MSLGHGISGVIIFKVDRNYSNCTKNIALTTVDNGEGSTPPSSTTINESPLE